MDKGKTRRKVNDANDNKFWICQTPDQLFEKCPIKDIMTLLCQ